MAKEEAKGTDQTVEQGLLSVVTTVDAGIRVVSPTGEIDQQTSEPLRQALDATTPPSPRVIADMSGVSFMDSTGINILITAHRNLTEAGGWLRMAAPTGAVLHTIQLVGIDTVIDCHQTLRGALHT
ncbi:STAS domain-containing protein [Streptomyces sp. Tu102]|uniref:STAS domain-containing protein n=1 Tax=Streptomyces TaxID=1883 RepID=UPI001BDD82CA|nr:STAS domain-containing protein [Streptomyces sp. Tu102]MBT1098067.1 STAS domain-containing protein [Streptomyces sp. Tu102]